MPSVQRLFSNFYILFWNLFGPLKDVAGKLDRCESNDRGLLIASVWVKVDQKRQNLGDCFNYSYLNLRVHSKNQIDIEERRRLSKLALECFRDHCDLQFPNLLNMIPSRDFILDEIFVNRRVQFHC